MATCTSAQSSANSAFSTPLTREDHFDEVYEKLFPARNCWYNIGLRLKVDNETLKQIEGKCRGDSEQALRDMLTQGFSKSLTWSKLCVALRSGIVKRNDRAEAIEKYVESKKEKGVTPEAPPDSSSTKQDVTPEASPSQESNGTRASTGSKRKSGPGSPIESPCSKKQKVAPTIRQDKITDIALIKIGREIGDKWLEVGVLLGMHFEDLQSRIEDNLKIPNERRPLHMLKDWQKVAADTFNYETLATALKEVGLNTCAMKYCYTKDSVTDSEQ